MSALVMKKSLLVHNVHKLGGNRVGNTKLDLANRPCIYHYPAIAIQAIASELNKILYHHAATD